LMQYFLQRYNKKFAKDIQGFEKKVLDCFHNYNWPGNVRELENFIERGVALEKGRIISASSLPSEVIYNLEPSAATGEDWQTMLGLGKLNLTRYLDNISKNIILKSLEINGGNVKKTAALLQINYRSLRYLIEKYNLRLHP
jgi:two-component system, NtrC family, response regulator PilR